VTEAPPASVAIGGVGLWMPGYPSASAWARREHDPESLRPAGAALARGHRRRAGMLTRAMADASAEAMAAAGVDPSTVRTISGSAIGEGRTMIGLLEQMWAEEPLSPAAFTVSVHNAAAGLISISNRNYGFVTSIAADYDTPAAALIEGLGLVRCTGQPVTIACADEDLPESLVGEVEPWRSLAAALVLVPDDASGPRLARVAVTAKAPAGGEPLAPASLEDELARNPQAGLCDLVDAILRGAHGWMRLDRGRGRGYVAYVEPA